MLPRPIASDVSCYPACLKHYPARFGCAGLSDRNFRSRHEAFWRGPFTSVELFGELLSSIVRAEFSKNMPQGQVEKSKRAFVSELRSVAEAVGLNVTCKQESSDKAVLDVYRRLARVVHPDKATGNVLYQQQLHDAKQRWEDAKKAVKQGVCQSDLAAER